MDWNLGTAARTLWQEARGEPIEGQRAVAHVLINRRNSGKWGDSLGSVCLARSQFSAWGPVSPLDPNMVQDFRASCSINDQDPALLELAQLIVNAEHEPDPTNGATHYYAKSIPAPMWAQNAIFCGQFGRQLFYRGVK